MYTKHFENDIIFCNVFEDVLESATLSLYLKELNVMFHELNLKVSLFSMVLKELIFIFYLLSWQLVLCCVTVLKTAPYIVHSAVYIFRFGPLRSVEIF